MNTHHNTDPNDPVPQDVLETNIAKLLADGTDVPPLDPERSAQIVAGLQHQGQAVAATTAPRKRGYSLFVLGMVAAFAALLGFTASSILDASKNNPESIAKTPEVSIGSTVFSDPNNNGLQDAGENINVAIPANLSVEMLEGMDNHKDVKAERVVSQPEYGTVTRQRLVSPARTKVVEVPAEYKTVSQRVEVSPGRYETRESRVMVSPPSQRVETVPARYATVTEQTVAKDASSRVEVQSRYDWVEEQVLVADEGEELVVTPAKYDTRQSRVMPTPLGQRVDPLYSVPDLTSQRSLADNVGGTVVNDANEVPTISTLNDSASVPPPSVAPASPRYETRTERIMVKPPRKVWQKVAVGTQGSGEVAGIVGSRGAVLGGSMNANAGTPSGQVMALVEIPPEYKTVTKRVLVQKQQAAQGQALDVIHRPVPPPPPVGEPSTEKYATIVENAFLQPLDSPLSTFSIDVDTASYANTRRYLKGGQLPPADAVRIEELINYFNYNDPEPEGDVPFAVATESASCPWNAEHQLVRIGLQAKTIDEKDVPPRNLVFLIDVSGSMRSSNKLGLLQSALPLLVDQLRPEDRLGIVVYAGNAGVILEPADGTDKDKIRKAIASLSAGGSTHGSQGIQRAYKMAREQFDAEGINRVILCTDGDFNVGLTGGALTRLIEKERESGVFLTVLGFGSGNINDQQMESLANKGNGNYAYIDSMDEAEKVLVAEAGGTLVAVAKDVKIQVEFNPAAVASYRLIGYENRKLAARDFNDDKKDAGEIGAGHSVTALYQVVPAKTDAKDVDPEISPLKYQSERKPNAENADELLTVNLRYKQPDGNTSKLLSVPVEKADNEWKDASENLRFAASVAGYGMLLRGSAHKGTADWKLVKALAGSAMGEDENGYRAEFLTLVESAETAR